RCTLTA
ncbi:hypothetical protein CP02DC18_1120B, partial [Chlamydia psittaci 02DC18]